MKTKPWKAKRIRRVSSGDDAHAVAVHQTDHLEFLRIEPLAAFYGCLRSRRGSSRGVHPSVIDFAMYWRRES